MKFMVGIFAAILLSSSILSSASLSFAMPPDQEDMPTHVPGKLLLKFKKDVSNDNKDEILSSNQAEIIDSIPQIDVKIISVPDHALQNIEDSLSKNDMVEYVEKDFLLEPTLIPNDPSYSSQWHLSKIGADKAWDVSTGSSTFSVAILDSGVDSNHPDLVGKLVNGYNFYDMNSNWEDSCGHGTKVAGVAAASTNNAKGIAGVAYDVQIMPLRITTPDCYGSYSAMSKAIVHAADNGAKSANISYRIFNGNVLTDSAQYMHSKGGWVVASGGNTYGFENYSDNPYLISVAATTSSDSRASFSSYGPYIDLAAPGSSIYTTSMGGSYSYSSGTSFSAPVVSGLVALMFSHNPSLSSAQVFDILKSTAVDLGDAGYDQKYGWGRVNANLALQSISDPIEDTTKPVVSITSPTSGATVGNTIPVTVDATDDVSMDRVSIFVDGVWQKTDFTSPYEFDLDTTLFSDGLHTLKATAFDSSENMAYDEIQITIDNSPEVIDDVPPSVIIINPTAGSKVDGKVTISVSASDDVAVSTVKIFIDGKLKTTFTDSPYKMNWNTKPESSGFHTILVKAIDTSGNVSDTQEDVEVIKGGSKGKP